MTTNVDFVTAMRRVDGKPYIFGAEVRLSDPSPSAFDCSEAVQWALWQAGGTIFAPDGTWHQANWCRAYGIPLDREQVDTVPGALWFDLRQSNGQVVDLPHYGGRPFIAHVGVTDGLGYSWEARSTLYGCGRFPLAGRTITHAFTVPGVIYLPPVLPQLPTEVGDMKFYIDEHNDIFCVGMTANGLRKQHVTTQWALLVDEYEPQLVHTQRHLLDGVPNV